MLLFVALPVLPAGAEEAGAPKFTMPEGLPDGLEGDLRATSIFLQPKPVEVTGSLALQREITRDMTSLHLLLNNYGYYDPLLTYTTSENRLTELKLDAGPRYILARYSLLGVPENVKVQTPATGQPAIARTLVDAEANALRVLAEAGYPLAKYTSRNYIVDHDADDMSAELMADAGPRLRMGDITYNGQQRTNTSYLQRLVPWKHDAYYSPVLVEQYRQALLGTELFSIVRIKPAEQSPDGTTLPLEVDVSERKQRTIGGSIGYDTDRGPGVEAFWQHRNVWGNGEQLELKAQYYLQKQLVGASLRAPNWPDRRTTLVSSIDINNEQSDAYNETGIVSELGLERKFSPIWTASFGGRLRISSVNSELVTNLALPLTVSADTTTSKLNPNSGLRSTSTFTPVLALKGEQGAYATWEQRLSGYYPLNTAKSVVFGSWIHFGGVLGANAKDIAPTSRFYAGGGSSVRGYEFRSLGARDASGDPLGGSAIMEGGVELRFPVHNNFSGVVFAEAGSVSDSTLPNFTEPQYAAGLGVRYTTSIAPLRFDVAVPLNPRKDDSRFQIYISIGQAF